MRNFVLKAFATGFGLGYLPVAPGTYGTLLAIPFAYFLLKMNPTSYVIFLILFTIFSIGIAEGAGRLFQEDDCQKIVIDEVAGFFFTMAFIPRTLPAFIIGFILFRLLDSLKPWPISYLDKNVGGGFGVVIDDVAAGIVGNIILQVLYFQTSILGARHF